MITNFKLYTESIDISGYFSVKNTTYQLKYADEIYILLNSEIYQNLSVTIPDSKFLDDNEFFINPDVDKEMIRVLIDENFIEESDKESIAGDKKTRSYRLV